MKQSSQQGLLKGPHMMIIDNDIEAAPPSDDLEEANVQRQRQKGGLNITMIVMMVVKLMIMMNMTMMILIDVKRVCGH